MTWITSSARIILLSIAIYKGIKKKKKNPLHASPLKNSKAYFWIQTKGALKIFRSKETCRLKLKSCLSIYQNCKGGILQNSEHYVFTQNQTVFIKNYKKKYRLKRKLLLGWKTNKSKFFWIDYFRMNLVLSINIRSEFECIFVSHLRRMIMEE